MSLRGRRIARRERRDLARRAKLARLRQGTNLRARPEQTPAIHRSWGRTSWLVMSTSVARGRLDFIPETPISGISQGARPDRKPVCARAFGG